MSRLMPIAVALAVCSLVIAVPAFSASWFQDGIPVCTASYDQDYPQLVSDGAGGAIIAWTDGRPSNAGIYVQRADAWGNDRWTANGVATCSTGGDRWSPLVAPDGAGGAIVVWLDNNVYGIYAQRVNAAGVTLWAPNGVAVCTPGTGRQNLSIVPDGAGGAIIVWSDLGGADAHIQAQRVNASGMVQWGADGVAVCAVAGAQWYPCIVSDGVSGAVIAWEDHRGSSADIYAQRVNAAGAPQWAVTGVPLCAAPGDQTRPRGISCGGGGMIVTWSDARSDGDIYAQRVNGSGAVQWTADGVAVCTETGYQDDPAITSGSADGAIITWEDDRSGSSHIYAQRLNASGAVQWTTDGVCLCAAEGNQWYARVVSDGSGGAVVVWRDQRLVFGILYSNLYVQRVDASGAAQWTADGIPLCATNCDRWDPQIISDGASGAIVTWYDHHAGSYDIYSQRVRADGRMNVVDPEIVSVRDVPGDQGGHVRVSIGRCIFDDYHETTAPISIYDVWQRVDDPTTLAALAQGNISESAGDEIGKSVAARSAEVDASSVRNLPVKEWNGRSFVRSEGILAGTAFPPGTWELVASFGACEQSIYLCRAATLADSTASGIPWAVVFVTAHTTNPAIWYASAVDSGYSVDNIPPFAPRGVLADQHYTPPGLALSWDPNTEDDLSHYAIYRGTSGGFVPSPGNRVATPSGAEWFDAAWRWSSGYYYKIAAVDIHDNQSAVALVAPSDVTGADTPKAPAATYLTQNYPNPFNPMTRIAYGLSAAGHVSLRIYDASGRLVRALVEGAKPAGVYGATWDGRDSRGGEVASGIYFYRLRAGAFDDTKKMALTR
ncbi:MAG: FlgD immunoglobulin-like domain containing protein [Candidatus Krumholzibacteriaceae bacterium]|jgi:transposase